MCVYVGRECDCIVFCSGALLYRRVGRHGFGKIEGIDFFFHAYLLSRVGANVIVSSIILHR